MQTCFGGVCWQTAFENFNLELFKCILKYDVQYFNRKTLELKQHLRGIANRNGGHIFILSPRGSRNHSDTAILNVVVSAIQN